LCLSEGMNDKQRMNEDFDNLRYLI
jgi:hypothetical protein